MANDISEKQGEEVAPPHPGVQVFINWASSKPASESQSGVYDHPKNFYGQVSSLFPELLPKRTFI